MKQLSLSNMQKCVLATGLLVASVLLMWMRSTLIPQIETANADDTDPQQVEQQISILQQEIKALEDTTKDSGKQIGVLAEEKDRYVALLGTLCQNNSLVVNKMTVGESKPVEGNLYALPVNVELQGTLPQIQSFLATLSQADYLCRVREISCREQAEYTWLWRQIDDDTFVPWWTVATAAPTEEAVTDTPAVPSILASTLMNASNMLCYIQLDYLGWDG